MRTLTLALTLLLSLFARAADKPNILIILADDQGWGDLSVHGNTNLSTPRIDSLASAGTLFERFYVCPVCSPTRAEFLTGRYHPRTGVHDVTTGGERLNLDERTIAQVFKSAGYATACFGKWHNGTQYPFHPNARGFDEYYGFTSGHWGDYFDPPLDHNGKPVRGKGFIIDDLTDHSIAFMQQNQAASKPFFCYLALNTPHTPAQVPDSFYKKFENAELKMLASGRGESIAKTRAVLAMVENIDHNVGRLLKTLDDLKIANDTIVLYFSDNGPNGARWNGGMRGVKGSTDEGGVRSPFLIRWPGHIPAGAKRPQIAGAIDLLPTLADLAGIALPPGKPLDGISLKPLLAAQPPANWPDRMIFSHWSNKVSVRTQQYRLDNAGRLYDMAADPGQEKDIAQQQPQVAARLAQAVADWRKNVIGEPKARRSDDRPFTVGYAQFPLTQLPARDGVGHGNVRRSAGAPNCSFFTHWTSRDDRITWNIDVHTAGTYKAVVYYTCSPADIGSTVELSFKQARTTAKVTPAHDPPLTGQEHDRVPRQGESYVKDFAPLPLGTIRLAAGAGELALTAPQVAGKQVMDVRMITLELVKE